MDIIDRAHLQCMLEKEWERHGDESSNFAEENQVIAKKSKQYESLTNQRIATLEDLLQSQRFTEIKANKYINDYISTFNLELDV